MKHLKIGTLVGMNDREAGLSSLRKFVQAGFETISLTWWQTLGSQNLGETADLVKEILKPAGVSVSCLSIFGNPLTGAGKNSETLAGWEQLIDHAADFGCDLVTGFTGRLPDQPLEASIPRFAEVFGPLARRAAGRHVRLAFENCTMEGTWHRGDWNLAHNPDAWKLLFDAVPDANVGLQWEPCHQMSQLIDPLPQLRQWAHRVFNVHGKDGTLAWDVIKASGIGGGRPYFWHRTPGFGDTNWNDVVTILMQAGYEGSIDIEGYHDPVHGAEWELSSQVRALKYLKECRGGDDLGPL
jgi:sugar phosphate isomerase/epimerase